MQQGTVETGREKALKRLLILGVVSAAGMVWGATAGAQGTGQKAGVSQVGVSQGGKVAPATPEQTLPKAAVSGFPPVNPKNFTAASPTVETVNSFLHALWGYDANRTWSVAVIEPTIAPGVVRVQAYISETTQPGKVGQTTLYVTPDGKHAIAGEVVNFGPQPFAETRALLQQRANGPSQGAAGKELELVEFADLECPSCKTAQSTLEQLQEDFPQARIVFENDPLIAVHPLAFQAAAVGYCVQEAKGSAAALSYTKRMYELQGELTKEKAEATLRTAVAAAGADPAAVLACAATPAAQDAVNATMKLAADVGVTNTPTLVVNGRSLPLAQVPYETLKRVIVFQGSLDGIAVREQPSLKSLK